MSRNDRNHWLGVVPARIPWTWSPWTARRRPYGVRRAHRLSWIVSSVVSAHSDDSCVSDCLLSEVLSVLELDSEVVDSVSDLVDASVCDVLDLLLELS